MKNGRKASHWMCYIFPQLKGLGKSSTSSYYGITDLEEAKDFLNDAYLGSNLLEISSALLEIECNDASKVMGKPDDVVDIDENRLLYFYYTINLGKMQVFGRTKKERSKSLLFFVNNYEN